MQSPIAYDLNHKIDWTFHLRRKRQSPEK